MKNNLFLFAILFSSVLLKAQGLQVIDTATRQPAVYNYYFTVPVNGLNVVSFVVKNPTGAMIKSKVNKNILSTISGHLVGFNYGSVMYAATTNYSIQEPIAAGDSLPDINGRTGLEAYFDASGYTGTSVVRYTVYDSLNHADSVHVTITYNAVVTGLKQNAEEIIPEAYPNPASNTIYFLPGNFTNATVTLFTSDGQNIKTKELTSVGKNEMDISKLEQGVYFYTINENGKIIKTKKLVIIK